MASKYKDYEERLKQMGYSQEIIKIALETIRLAEGNITNPSRHGLTAETQKIIENNFK